MVSSTTQSAFISSAALPLQGKRPLTSTEEKTQAVFRVRPDFDGFEAPQQASLIASPSPSKRKKIEKPDMAGDLLSSQGTQCTVYHHRNQPNQVVKAPYYPNLDKLDKVKNRYLQLQSSSFLKELGIHILETEFHEDSTTRRYYVIQDRVTPFSSKENEPSADRKLLDSDRFLSWIRQSHLIIDLRPSNLGVDSQGRIVCFDPFFPEDEEFELHQAAMIREWEAFKKLQEDSK